MGETAYLLRRLSEGGWRDSREHASAAMDRVRLLLKDVEKKALVNARRRTALRCYSDLIIKPPALPVRIHKALPFLRQPVHVPVPDPGATSKPSHVGMSSNEERR
jgi:hypothetical protein